MPSPLHYHWELDLQSPPDALWEYLADTDRLNQDIGFSPISRDDTGDIINNRKRAHQTIMGRFEQAWIEEPFQWVRPQQYTATRNYTRGFFNRIIQSAHLTPLPDGGTHIDYRITVFVRYQALRPFVNRSFSNMPFKRLFQHYDEQIQAQQPVLAQSPFIQLNTEPLTSEAQTRLNALAATLVDQGIPPTYADHLTHLIQHGDNLSLMTIRPYELADRWGVPRRSLLEACLIATRIGLLDMHWNLLCPLCRGAKSSVTNLSSTTDTVHCEVCRIDYEANFEQSVELTFTPNPSIRRVPQVEYCVGGPEVTPHIAVQQLLASGDTRELALNLPPGRYRARTMTLPGQQYLRIDPLGDPVLVLRANRHEGWHDEEHEIAPHATLTLTNSSDSEQLFVIEHLQWSDHAVTAAEVTTRQMFRDLFASEALRPNEQIVVGSLTIVFTDLRGSTQMYQQIGDAPAFGRVMQHFDVLRTAIREQDGAIVKTIGDAVMAVFQQPDNAVRAMIQAQHALQATAPLGEALALRVGIHSGRCIAVTLNERLDYFGTTVNLAARLEGQSAGGDLVLSNAVYADPAVQRFLTTHSDQVFVEPFATQLKGFDTSVEVWRVVPLSSHH